MYTLKCSTQTCIIIHVAVDVTVMRYFLLFTYTCMHIHRIAHDSESTCAADRRR